MGVHSSDRGYFNRHVLAELKDDVLRFEGIGNDVTVSPVIIILINKFHESSDKVGVSAVEEDEVATKGTFFSPVEKFRNLNVLKKSGSFLILVLPQQTIPLLATRDKVLIVLMPLKFPDLITVISKMVPDGQVVNIGQGFSLGLDGVDGEKLIVVKEENVPVLKT
jgi:hypothetical protein